MREGGEAALAHAQPAAGPDRRRLSPMTPAVSRREPVLCRRLRRPNMPAWHLRDQAGSVQSRKNTQASSRCSTVSRFCSLSSGDPMRRMYARTRLTCVAHRKRIDDLRRIASAVCAWLRRRTPTRVQQGATSQPVKSTGSKDHRSARSHRKIQSMRIPPMPSGRMASWRRVSKSAD